MRDKNYCHGYGGGASCTKVGARATFVPNANFGNSSLRSSFDLTSAKDGVELLVQPSDSKGNKVKLLVEDRTAPTAGLSVAS